VAAHERASGIVAELRDVVVVPIEGRDGAIVVARVEHDEIEELADLKGAPYAEIVVHVDLADASRVRRGFIGGMGGLRHPLKVRSHGVHLALINAYAAGLD
jgi:hypothetical protein